MSRSLVDQFARELDSLIEKYSDMEMTNAEAIGVLEMIKFDIIKNANEDDEEYF